MSGATAPGAANLERFGRATGISVDWLLGFPVPPLRGERELVSDLAEQLREYVLADFSRRLNGDYDQPRWLPGMGTGIERVVPHDAQTFLDEICDRACSEALEKEGSLSDLFVLGVGSVRLEELYGTDWKNSEKLRERVAALPKGSPVVALRRSRKRRGGAE